MRQRHPLSCAGAGLFWLIGCGSSGSEPPKQSDGGPSLDATAPVHDAGSSDANARLDGGADADASLDADGGVTLKLSETGLYADTQRGTLAQGVEPYTPNGVLWADMAQKRRWVYLPEGTQIDTSDMDNWVYPVGTKIWKEFTLGDKRIETRLIEKSSADTWTLIAYQWNADQSDAVAVPDGVRSASGTAHDIPSTYNCKRCHDGMADEVLGFSAIQLAHDGPGVTLASLVADGRLSHPPAGDISIPGDAQARAALLYLHANCGSCHNARTFISNVTNVDYWLKSGGLDSVESTTSYATALYDLRKHGSVEKTDLIKRVLFRGQGQMPPLATKQIDDAGVSLIRTWLGTLPLPDAGPSDGGAQPDGGADAGSADAGP